MYCVTQTNKAHPSVHLRMSLQAAEELASNMCPKVGDSAIIYHCQKVGTCEASAVIEVENRAALEALFVDINQDYDDREAEEARKQADWKAGRSRLMSYRAPADTPADTVEGDLT